MWPQSIRMVLQVILRTTFVSAIIFLALTVAQYSVALGFQPPDNIVTKKELPIEGVNIVRTEQGLKAWELTEPHLDYHDLEDKGAVGKLQGWDKKKAFDSLKRPFDPDAPRFIDYTDHAENYGTEMNPHDAGH